jgi:Uma2 family endonuclease
MILVFASRRIDRRSARPASRTEPGYAIRSVMTYGRAEERRFDSFDAYLGWEEKQPGRYELHDGFVVLMAGASEDHKRIALRAHFGLRNRCAVFRADMTLRIGELTNRYADVFVVCSEGAPQNRRYYDDTRIVIEIISSDYESKELVVAPVEYARIASLEQYVVIDSRTRAAWSHLRQADGRFVLIPAEDERIEIPCENLTFAFSDVSAGTTLDT